MSSEALAREVAAAREAAAVHALDGHVAVVLAGRDAARFLHGQCTQEVKGKKPGDAGYAFLLDGRGRNLGDFTFAVREDAMFCFVPRPRAAAFAARLQTFVVAADVAITTGGWSGLLILGPGASAVLAAVAGAGDVIVEEQGLGVPGHALWTRAESIEAAAAACLAAGAQPIGGEAFDTLRIEAGHALYGRDFDEGSLPVEARLDERAVSYTKGCYVGQEVVAKQKYLGKPRRMISGLLPERVVPCPAPVADAGGVEVGRVTSCVWSPTLARPIALAMLRYPPPPEGTALRVGDVAAVVAALPFVRPS